MCKLRVFLFELSNDESDMTLLYGMEMSGTIVLPSSLQRSYRFFMEVNVRGVKYYHFYEFSLLKICK